jgi:hypothetical protein
MRAVSRLNPQQRAVSLDYQVRLPFRIRLSDLRLPQGSSIGAYSAGWARRVHSFCKGHQPRGSAQHAKITPRCDADARAQHVEDTVSDVGLGAQKRARRGGRWNDVLSEEYVGSRQVSSEPIW